MPVIVPTQTYTLVMFCNHFTVFQSLRLSIHSLYGILEVQYQIMNIACIYVLPFLRLYAQDVFSEHSNLDANCININTLLKIQKERFEDLFLVRHKNSFHFSQCIPPHTHTCKGWQIDYLQLFGVFCRLSWYRLRNSDLTNVPGRKQRTFGTWIQDKDVIKTFPGVVKECLRKTDLFAAQGMNVLQYIFWQKVCIH